jgi:dolichol-phosphate mannosyltransferase
MKAYKPKKLSIIIPSYNEESTVEELMQKVFAVKLSIPKEIIVVDDSNDGTRAIMKKYHKAKKIKLILNDRPRGKGYAVKRGLEKATGDIVIIQDADLEYEPEDYHNVLKPFYKGAQVVYGSRRRMKSNKQYAGLSFLIGGVGLTLVTNIIYPRLRITDEPTCYKTFRTDLMRSLNIQGNGFEWEPEITAKIARRRIKIHEVPIHYYPRKKADGAKIKWSDGVKAVLTLLKYRF